jgi:cobalt-zinc-cadmium resistance protein CzcA
VNYLVLIDGIDLLPQLFTTVVLPAGVLAELQHPRTPRRVATARAGDDLTVLKDEGDKIVRALNGVPGAADVQAQQIAGLPYVRVIIRRDKLARYGINATALLDAVSVIGGQVVGEVFEGQRRFPLQVRLAPAWREDLATLEALTIETFGSVSLTMLISLNVPVAATGGIFALWLRGMPFSISAGVGFIALFGIAVMNGVVLVEHIRHLRRAGEDCRTAVFQGSLDRLKPVMMTATTDALGFLPMAVSGSAGAEVQRPLATVVIGGLVTCTLLTLLVLPAIYRWFEPAAADRPVDLA